MNTRIRTLADKIAELRCRQSGLEQRSLRIG
jgi:hypothetical protein